MTTPKLLDVMQKLKWAIESALSAASAPGAGQVYLGWPTGSEEVQKLGQPYDEGSITIFPIRSSSNVTRYSNQARSVSRNPVNLLRTVVKNVVTFSGTCDAVYNIHGFIAGRFVDAYYATTAGQSLTALATAYAQAVNNLAVPGVTASASGASVTLHGAQWQVVNIGGTGTFFIEQFRVQRILQVSLWINDPLVRETISEIILNAIGISGNHFLTLSDGTAAYIRYFCDNLDETSQSSYSMYLKQIWYSVEYGQNTAGTAYEVEGIGATLGINGVTPSQPSYFGQ